MNSDLDILLQPAKVKIIQLSCFSDLYKGDWMGNRVYDLQYIQLPLVTDLTDEEQDYFIKLAPRILGDSCRKPKFFNLFQWVEQG